MPPCAAIGCIFELKGTTEVEQVFTAFLDNRSSYGGFLQTCGCVLIMCSQIYVIL